MKTQPGLQRLGYSWYRLGSVLREHGGLTCSQLRSQSCFSTPVGAMSLPYQTIPLTNLQPFIYFSNCRDRKWSPQRIGTVTAPNQKAAHSLKSFLQKEQFWCIIILSTSVQYHRLWTNNKNKQRLLIEWMGLILHIGSQPQIFTPLTPGSHDCTLQDPDILKILHVWVFCPSVCICVTSVCLMPQGQKRAMNFRELFLSTVWVLGMKSRPSAKATSVLKCRAIFPDLTCEPL